MAPALRYAAFAGLASFLFPAFAAAATAAELVGLAPHRAVYEITLVRSSAGSGVADMSGRMVYELTGSACEGYTQNMRFVTQMVNQGGTAMITDLRSFSWEEGNGSAFASTPASTATRRRPKRPPATPARANGDDVKVELTKPAKKDLSPAGARLLSRRSTRSRCWRRPGPARRSSAPISTTARRRARRSTTRLVHRPCAGRRAATSGCRRSRTPSSSIRWRPGRSPSATSSRGRQGRDPRLRAELPVLRERRQPQAVHRLRRFFHSRRLEGSGVPRYASLRQEAVSGAKRHALRAHRGTGRRSRRRRSPSPRSASRRTRPSGTRRATSPSTSSARRRALGMATIYVPEDKGGSGLSRLDGALIMEALAYGCPAIAGYISIHNMVAWMVGKYALAGAGGGVDAEARLDGVAVELLPDRARRRLRCRRAQDHGRARRRPLRAQRHQAVHLRRRRHRLLFRVRAHRRRGRRRHLGVRGDEGHARPLLRREREEDGLERAADAPGDLRELQGAGRQPRRRGGPGLQVRHERASTAGASTSAPARWARPGPRSTRRAHYMFERKAFGRDSPTSRPCSSRSPTWRPSSRPRA